MSTSSTNLSLTLQTGSEGKGDRLTVLNANWNKVDAKFHGTTGHTHAGSSGNGPKIAVASIDPTGTTDGQVLTSTGAGTNPAWEAVPSAAVAVRNETGGTLAIGTLVYASSWDEAETSWLITKADADVAGAEALFVLTAALNNNTNGTAQKSHRFTSQNTSGLTVGNPAYLSTTAGGWTATAPAAFDDLQIVVGRIAVVDSSNGVVEINIDTGQTLKIGSNQIQDDIIDSAHITNASIDTAHIADNQVTLGKTAHGTQGGVQYYASGGAPSELAAGTSGHFLKTQGGSANPVWAAAAGGKVQQHSFVEGSSGVIATTSNSYVDITDMKRTITTTGGNLVCRLSMNIDCDNSGTYFYAAFQLDSASEEGEIGLQAGSNGETYCMTLIYTFTSVSSAEHVVDARWHTSSGNSLDCDADQRFMEVMEIDT